MKFTTSAAMVDLVDKKVLVILQDGRNLRGVLRAYDEFAHFVLEDAVEYIYRGTRYAGIWCGIFVIPGENVMLLGEIDMDVDEAPNKFLVEYHALERFCKKDAEMRERQEATKAQILREQKGYSEEEDKYIAHKGNVQGCCKSLVET
ncbi:U6 snRNA-associated Sm-like protein LSm1 [Mycena sanguinolenta]|uniref:U6 snRNA-associated Sm-like protein LSm1 n=1 Tax=Mycena sanguinolenta TaxID=230812 RepID=A0A8H7DIE2_9AGAR|nr:U6 snRNA-associated Sm-like protein LSm1 [Mycena sanguinolenta]